MMNLLKIQEIQCIPLKPILFSMNKLIFYTTSVYIFVSLVVPVQMKTTEHFDSKGVVLECQFQSIKMQALY